MLNYEHKVKQSGYNLVIGVDEAGRGPLAGPVVAAAVSLNDYEFDARIRDSKKLSPKQRETAFYEIWQKADVGVGIVSAAVVDHKNILNATHYAMSIAVENLMRKLPVADEPQNRRKVFLLIDGNSFKTDLTYAHKTVVKGDSLSLSIASASIIAKVTRDRILKCYDKIFPQYGFKQHKGYPTEAHRNAIKEHGPSIIHRRSFRF